MEYRNLGKSGLQVSVVGLGCNNFGWHCDLEQSQAVVSRALEQGITFFDTADIYPPGGPKGLGEEYLGEALKGHRREVILATKFAGSMGDGPLMSGASRRYIRLAVQASLRRLQTDYLDLYQVHRPDPKTPIEETLSTLDDLVRSGLVRYVGCSTFNASQIVEAAWVAKTEHLTRFISAQNEYNLLNRSVESEVLPVCSRYGLGMLPFYPLASGFLTGKYRPDAGAPEGTRLAAGGRAADRVLTEGNFATLKRLEAFADTRRRSVLDVAIAYLAAQPAVGSVIAGATKPDQVEANVRAGDWKLTADEAAEVAALTRSG